MSRAAIKPDAHVPVLWAFYPPEPDKLYQLYLMGQRNAQAWIDAQPGAAAAAAAAAACPPSPTTSAGPRWAGYAAAARAAAATAAAEASQQAEACGAYALGVAAEAGRFAEQQRGLLRRARERAVKTLCVALIYCELLAQAAASGVAAALPCGVPRARAWERCKSFARPLPALASYALSAPRSPAAARMLATQAAVLSQLSLFYRLVAYAMV